MNIFKVRALSGIRTEVIASSAVISLDITADEAIPLVRIPDEACSSLSAYSSSGGRKNDFRGHIP